MLKTRLEKFYEKVVCEDWILLYNIKNQYTLPVFDKAVLNSTSNTFVSQREALLQSFSAFFLQTGQFPISTRAHKSIALFNIRQGSILGLKTTLRRKGLYNYLDKALIFVIPKAFSSRSLQTEIGSPVALFTKKGLVQNDKHNVFTKQLRHSLRDAFTGGDEKSFFRLKAEGDGQLLKVIEKVKGLPENNYITFGEKKSTLFRERKRGGQINNQNKGFVISDNKITRFPEVLSLLLFFNSTTGFSLDCSFSFYGQKALSKIVSLSNKKKRSMCCNKKDRFLSAFGFLRR